MLLSHSQVATGRVQITRSRQLMRGNILSDACCKLFDGMPWLANKLKRLLFILSAHGMMNIALCKLTKGPDLLQSAMIR